MNVSPLVDERFTACVLVALLQCHGGVLELACSRRVTVVDVVCAREGEFLSLIMPESAPYFLKWLLVISGTAMLALAVAFSFTASVAMVPGEYFIKIFHPIVKKSFSYVKTFFDVFLVSSAVILSLFLTGFTEIEGVREGTVFAALSTGPMVHYFIPRCARIIPYLKPRI